MAEEITQEEDAERAKAWLRGQRIAKREYRPEVYKKEEEEKNEG